MPNKTRNAEFSLDQIDLTPTEDSDFSVNVTTGPAATTESAPNFRVGAETDPLGIMRVDHSIPDSKIDSVAFIMRVNKTTLEARNLTTADVVMYRYHDDAWTALSTSVVDETASHYVLRVDSPGLSYFAVASRQPAISVTDVSVAPTTASPGDQVTITATIENTGAADGEYEARLQQAGETAATTTVTVAAGSTVTTQFDATVESAGEVTFAVEDVSTTVTVAAPATPTATATPKQQTTTDSTTTHSTPTEGNGPGFGLGVTLIAVVAVALLARRHR